MVLANLFILIWNYDKLKYILPFRKLPNYLIIEKPKEYSYKFPWVFFFGVVLTIFSTIVLTEFAYDTMPHNSLEDCKNQFRNTKNEVIGFDFCECIHKNGRPLDKCLDELEKAKK